MCPARIRATARWSLMVSGHASHVNFSCELVGGRGTIDFGSTAVAVAEGRRWLGPQGVRL